MAFLKVFICFWNPNHRIAAEALLKHFCLSDHKSLAIWDWEASLWSQPLPSSSLRREDGEIRDPLEKHDPLPWAQAKSLLPFLVLEPGGGVCIS